MQVAAAVHHTMTHKEHATIRARIHERTESFLRMQASILKGMLCW